MLGLIIAVILIVLPLTVSLQDDPCNSYRMLSDDGGRSIKCDLYYSDSHDRFIDEGWRRVQLESTGEDLTMPTMCVPSGFCGSHSNVWLDGSHPTVEDGIVDRMGCLSSHPTVEDDIVDRMGCLSMSSSCCKVKYPIQIKNCTDYMVYNLKRTSGSDQRYCFGDSNDCYLTTRPTTDSSNTQGNRRNRHGFGSDYQKDDMITILGVCLTIAIAALFVLAFCIFCYFRQRKLQYELDTKPTKA
ncbi:hypothetical protein LOTGIDRAFT_170575 [Lottia gigantea]|uniref:UMOD/GP2/OIT3-like D8C domain-containing protein n=1 Tax=Lottia gigantea TaxID=225164 RepID=V4BB21_LOTGI|nr:hypothetical protein LOTGIDRAFT_170575 [Lottia gigantea]ESP04741.1 hypothetical protein LOTGIDRAFT_170575 [Lottia gigantea]